MFKSWKCIKEFGDLKRHWRGHKYSRTPRTGVNLLSIAREIDRPDVSVQASYCVDHLAQAQIYSLTLHKPHECIGHGKRTIPKFQHCFRPSTEHFLVPPDENKTSQPSDTSNIRLESFTHLRLCIPSLSDPSPPRLYSYGFLDATLLLCSY